MTSVAFRGRRLLIVVGIAFGALMAAQAQFDPRAVRRVNNELANEAVSAVEVFSAGKITATGNFHYDNKSGPDTDFSTYKLPLAHSFGDPTNTLRPFIEGYLGYFDLGEEAALNGQHYGDYAVRSFTTTLGGGVAWRVNNWFSVTPGVALAYSHVWQIFDAAPVPGNPFAAILRDWQADALSLLPALELNATWPIKRWTLGADSRYTYIHVYGLHNSDRNISLGSDSQVWRNGISAAYRSPWTLLEMPVTFSGGFARHDVFGKIRQSGFGDHFYEARLTVAVAALEMFRPISEIGISGAYYFKGRFSGYSIGLVLDF